MKRCNKCGLDKPADTANWASSKAGKLLAICKKCRTENAKAWYVANKEKVKQNRDQKSEAEKELARQKARLRYKLNPTRAIEATRAWQKQNAERLTKYLKAWRAENKDKLQAYHTAWKIKYPHMAEKHQKLSRMRSVHWAKTNPSRALANCVARDLAKQRRTPNWLTEEDKRQIKSMYMLSEILTQCTGIKHNVDHIVPLRGKLVSGLHAPYNLQVLTETQNKEKGAKYTFGE